MAHKLADELLKEILAPPLRVPDLLFNDISRVSPFSKAEHSASDVLLVCKRWMRVGTPALYECVVVRSVAQAAALSAALTRNPELGRFTRMLRLEGTYAHYLTPAVLSSMPNIVELCIPIGLMAAEKPKDLQALLKQTALQIQKLLLVNYRGGNINSTRTKLLESIATAVEKSMSLNSLSCPYPDWEALKDLITDSLPKLPCFKGLFVMATNSLIEPRLFDQVRSANGSLRSLIIFFPDGPSHYTSILKKSWRSHFGDGSSTLSVSFTWPGGSLTVAPTTPTVPTAEPAPPNAFWHPMQSVGRELRISIWHRIVSFAIRMQPDEGSRFSSHSAWVINHNIDEAAMEVIRKVSRELSAATIRAVVTTLQLINSKVVQVISSQLNKDPALRSLVTSISIHMRAVTRVDAFVLFARIRYLERLEINHWPSSDVLIDKPRMSWATPIGLTVGYSLRFLAVNQYQYSFRRETSSSSHSTPSLPYDPIAVFGRLTALEELFWGTDTIAFTVGNTESLARMQGLCRLKLLRVLQGHRTFFDFLASTSLPSLVDVNFDTHMKIEPANNFLIRHGPSIISFVAPLDLTQGVLDHLTHLEVLALPAKPMESFFMKKRLPSVKKVMLSWPTYDRRDISRYSGASKDIAKHGSGNFPNLKEIWVDSNNIWPTTEREEKKNQWLPINEILTEAGVILKDSSGRAWRKRLTVASATKKR